MKRKPWSLIVLALIHLFAPIGNIYVNSVLINTSPIAYFKALFLIENRTHAFVFLLIPVLCAACIYSCKKWSYKAYLALMSVPFAYSFWSWRLRPSAENFTVLCAFYIINVGIVGYFLIPAIRNIYFNPRMRWWETKPRYATDFQSELKQEEGLFHGYIKNISVGGFFIETQDFLKLDALTDVSFKSAEKSYLVKATPVFRRTSSPLGYGFKVEDAEAKKGQLVGLVNELKKEGIVIGARAPGPEDSFFYWIKSVFSKSAWIPEAKKDQPATLAVLPKTGSDS